MHRAVAKKKILALEMGQKKNSGRQKIPHPPITFLMVRPLCKAHENSTQASYCSLCWPIFPQTEGGGGEGELNKILHGEAPPGSSNPCP